MKRISNECVGCPPEMGCIGSCCPHRNVTRYYCDECGAEGKLYDVYGEELCADCALTRLDVVEGSDEY